MKYEQTDRQTNKHPDENTSLMYRYSVTHNGWDFRDDCTEFILFFPPDIHTPLIYKLVAINAKSFNTQLKYCIQV